VAYAGGAAGFWVGGFGSPDQYTPTLGGATWRSNNGGGTLISPGFGFTLRGSDALAVGVAVFATSYTGQQQNGTRSEKPPIDYEQWARVQGDLDMLRRRLLMELSMARPKEDFVKRTVAKIQDLMRQIEGRRVDSTNYRKKLNAWIRCAQPFVDDMKFQVGMIDEYADAKAKEKGLNAAGHAYAENLANGEGNWGPLFAYSAAVQDSAIDDKYAKLMETRSSLRDAEKACGPKYPEIRFGEKP